MKTALHCAWFCALVLCLLLLGVLRIPAKAVMWLTGHAMRRLNTIADDVFKESTR